MLRWLILITLISISTLSFGQQRLLQGVLRDSLTHFPIAGGTLTAGSSQKTVRTDEKGLFSLLVSEGEVIYATAPGYRFNTLLVRLLVNDTITLNLQPLDDPLPVVTIVSGYSRYQQDSLQRRRSFEEARGQRMNTVSRASNMGFGVGINLDRLFSPRHRDQKRAEDLFERTEKEAYVRFRFSPQAVAYYTGLRGERLAAFIRQYTPTYQWLRLHPSNEEVFFYINESLKAFRKQKQGLGPAP